MVHRLLSFVVVYFLRLLFCPISMAHPPPSLSIVHVHRRGSFALRLGPRIGPFAHATVPAAIDSANALGQPAGLGVPVHHPRDLLARRALLGGKGWSQPRVRFVPLARRAVANDEKSAMDADLRPYVHIDMHLVLHSARLGMRQRLTHGRAVSCTARRLAAQAHVLQRVEGPADRPV